MPVLRGMLPMAVLLLLGKPLWAADWLQSLQGERTQGTLLRGQVLAGVSVWLGDKPVRTTPDGFFAVGFARDADLHPLLVLRRQGEQQTVALTLEPRQYPIQRVNGVPERTVKTPPPAVLARIQREVAQVKAARDTDSSLTAFLTDFRWPLTGPVTGVYGSQRVYNGKPGRPHYGVDVARPAGTLVVAPADGTVTLVQPDNYYSGGTLIIDHGYGVSSTMIHLSAVLVKAGQQVKQGQPVARVGQSGRATGPHLDWRLNWYQQRLDPQTVVPPMPTE
ncbi:M24/M37 family peptidase [Alcanivorax hongdengensis A-11-3]|uniref:M24/M37 family peptidase n=1 Tax=Alcanivorax hongdengensis A-11-3 TaxID=1177179 RepID=L0WI71_9GAMM|nr:M23 family metallopeptidase [Alcanivorax hongdengensis]EKF75857.1 M24/M37 family peptidase [Alcanivorax hongdengensis A-11-3]